MTESVQHKQLPRADDAFEKVEIERDKLMTILGNSLKKEVEFLFNNRINALREAAEEVQVTFATGPVLAFDLMFGCDGDHSGVRKMLFGKEPECSHFLNHYFSLTIVDKLLLAPRTAQLYNVPGRDA
jgi:2-polyprenyl-6-methoxyphenol hydroxylase-like FAD-dependent oxidoreductase